MSKFLLVLEQKAERRRCFNAIKPLGARITHDSSGRAVVVETDDRKRLEKVLPDNARLLDISQDIEKTIREPDESEALFLRALQKRYSKEYRDMKAGQKPGESPEEIEFFSAPHTPEE